MSSFICQLSPFHDCAVIQHFYFSFLFLKIPKSHSGVYCWLVTLEVVMLRHCLRHDWNNCCTLLITTYVTCPVFQHLFICLLFSSRLMRCYSAPLYCAVIQLLFIALFVSRTYYKISQHYSYSLVHTMSVVSSSCLHVYLMIALLFSTC